jgi:hypothetical protein
LFLSVVGRLEDDLRQVLGEILGSSRGDLHDLVDIMRVLPFVHRTFVPLIDIPSSTPIDFPVSNSKLSCSSRLQFHFLCFAIAITTRTFDVLRFSEVGNRSSSTSSDEN